MGAHAGARNRKAEADPGLPRGLGLGAAVEGLEDLLQILGRQAGAVVGDLDDRWPFPQMSATDEIIGY